MIKVRGYSLPQVEVAGVRTPLYPHQAAMLNEWDSHDAFVLTTKTGSGKTRAVALPILKRRESAVLVYPTNALIADQARAIQQLMRDEGVTYREWKPENAKEKLGSEEYALAQVSANTLERFRKEWGLARKGDALLRLLEQKKRKLVLVNPDILYLIFALRFGRASGEAIQHFQAYTTVVFDEFHLYGGVELAHVLFVIHLALRMNTFKRVVLLSATPSAEVGPSLRALLEPREVDASEHVQQPSVRERPVAHDVDLLPLSISRGDVVETARAKVLELKSELEQLRAANAEANTLGDYVPCVVILNSVVNAIALEDALLDAGITQETFASIRGLSARSSRDVRGKLLVIGTSAIEVGIDFQADYLLFEAGDAASFMQRFGRIGRHRRGRALLLCDYREAAALRSLGGEISREVLERRIATIYPELDARAWFVSTFGGMVSICAQAHNFTRRIAEDWAAEEAMKSRINKWMEETLVSYSQTLDIEGVLKQTRPKLKRPWFKQYAEIDSFRTSLPSQEVWDVSEKQRGREWNYEADVKTLITRAERLWFNDKHERLYVRGYGARRRVWFARTFDDSHEIVGTIQTTAEYPPEQMQFIQEGHLTPVSHVMHKPQHHIFVVAPFELTRALDWRIAWFRCGAQGRYIIAFDGDALLLREIHREWKSSSSSIRVPASLPRGGPKIPVDKSGLPAGTVSGLGEGLGEDLVAVVLFGSRARGEEREGSDWDVLVIARRLPEKTLERAIRLKRMLPPEYRGEVSLLSKTPEEFVSNLPDLYLDIALDGIVLYDTDEYMAKRLQFLNELIRREGLQREREDGDLIWRRTPATAWSLQWETGS